MATGDDEKPKYWQPGVGRGGMNELHDAAYRGDLHTVLVCLRNGMDVNACDDHGYTPLHWNADMGSTGDEKERAQILHVLVLAGADVNAKNGDGLTPSIRARESTSGYLADLRADYGATG